MQHVRRAVKYAVRRIHVELAVGLAQGERVYNVAGHQAHLGRRGVDGNYSAGALEDGCLVVRAACQEGQAGGQWCQGEVHRITGRQLAQGVEVVARGRRERLHKAQRIAGQTCRVRSARNAVAVELLLVGPVDRRPEQVCVGLIPGGAVELRANVGASQASRGRVNGEDLLRLGRVGGGEVVTVGEGVHVILRGCEGAAGGRQTKRGAGPHHTGARHQDVRGVEAGVVGRTVELD